MKWYGYELRSWNKGYELFLYTTFNNKRPSNRNYQGEYVDVEKRHYKKIDNLKNRLIIGFGMNNMKALRDENLPMLIRNGIVQ